MSKGKYDNEVVPHLYEAADKIGSLMEKSVDSMVESLKEYHRLNPPGALQEPGWFDKLTFNLFVI